MDRWKKGQKKSQFNVFSQIEWLSLERTQSVLLFHLTAFKRSVRVQDNGNNSSAADMPEFTLDIWHSTLFSIFFPLRYICLWDHSVTHLSAFYVNFFFDSVHTGSFCVKLQESFAVLAVSCIYEQGRTLHVKPN